MTEHLSLVQPTVLLGLLMGGSVIYWFTGASCQAVVTGAYRAVVYIKDHIKLDSGTASIADSKEVVKICTVYAQKGMINIFHCYLLLFAGIVLSILSFFIAYLIGLAFFGLFQAIFMANAGGWDNAKKSSKWTCVRKELRCTPPQSWATRWETPSRTRRPVSLNPVIKFTTLFGLLATEIAVTMSNQTLKTGIGVVFFIIALIFVYRSFYCMRIPEEDAGAENKVVLPHDVKGTSVIANKSQRLARFDFLAQGVAGNVFG